MVKICKKFAQIIFFLIVQGFCFAETEKTSWVIGAVEFTYRQDFVQSEYEKAVLSAIPKLILEQLYGTKTRNVPDEEILNRKIHSLVKERLALFLELSKEQKTKDALVIQNLSEYQFQKQTAVQEKKIKEITQKIDDNLANQEKLMAEFNSEKPPLRREAPDTEDFSFYKSDSSELFKFSQKIEKIDYAAFDCSAEIINAKINGLVTGTVAVYGGYAAVSAEMFLYPGAVSTGVITEIGLISEPEKIAKNIAYRLVPKIENAIPCEIQISIKPESLKDIARVTIDSTVYNKIPDKLVLSNGVHNFSFECEGYRKESFSYGFGYEKKYLIEVEFFKQDLTETALVLKKAIAGNLFYNGLQAEDNVMSVKINNSGVLGYYYTDKGNTMFFMIPKNQFIDDKAVTANLKDYDIGADIEKKRRMMYISYSALICSLPFLFYSYSSYSTLYKGYVAGTSSISIDDIKKYQTMSYIGIGVSAGLGIWFVAELVAYLISANKALPVETRKSNVDFDTAVENHKIQQQEFKAENEKTSENLEVQKEKTEDNIAE